MAFTSQLFVMFVAMAIFAVTNFGVYADDDEVDAALVCPNVEDLQCTQNQPVPAGCSKQAYIILEDGTKCDGCEFCIEDGVVSLAREFGKQCPPIPCPMIAPADDCNATMYSQKVELMGSDCDACETFACAV